MGLFSSQKCSKCNSKISQNAPVSSKLGLDIGQKLMSGQISQNDVVSFYKSIGAKCPKCGKLICSYCYDSAGKRCPSCGSNIKYFY